MKYIVLGILFLYLFYKLAKWVLRIALRISFQELAKSQVRQQGYYQQGDVIIQTNTTKPKPNSHDFGDYVDYKEVK
jgi:hypothetical protein